MRNLVGEILDLMKSQRVFSDLHLEQDRPPVIKTPKGWEEIDDFFEPNLDDLSEFLQAIDPAWEDILESGRALDRPFALSTCRLRCNVYRVDGKKRIAISIRKLPLNPLPLESTGLPPHVKAMLESGRGLVLITGQTGSGKTTTAAAMLDQLNATRSMHIETIEDPIEYVHDRKKSVISQKEVGLDVPDFATGLRECLRQRPDAMLVGEVRDRATAETLLNAAESGHLVLATLHTNSAAGAIAKILGFFGADEQQGKRMMLANSLIGVICQALLPTKDGTNFVLAAEILFNHTQEFSAAISEGDMLKVTTMLNRRENQMNQSLHHCLATLVSRNQVSRVDADRAAYNRMQFAEEMKKFDGAAAPA